MASPDRLLTDRTSYIAYLESQLERVSAACLTVQSFDERLEQAVSGIRCLEEKVLNLARLVSCTQQFAEAQEAAARDTAADVGKRLRAVEARLEELDAPGRAAEWEAKLRAGRAGETERQLHERAVQGPREGHAPEGGCTAYTWAACSPARAKQTAFTGMTASCKAMHASMVTLHGSIVACILWLPAPLCSVSSSGCQAGTGGGGSAGAAGRGGCRPAGGHEGGMPCQPCSAGAEGSRGSRWATLTGSMIENGRLLVLLGQGNRG